MRRTKQFLLIAIFSTLFASALPAQKGEPVGNTERPRDRSTPPKPAAPPCTKPAWQCHLDWSSRDQGYVDCPAEYLAYSPQCHLCVPGWKGHPDCLNVGGRARMMEYAKASAKAGNCNQAFSEAVVTQCHNGPAIDQIRAAGVEAVCGYLKGIGTLASSALVDVPKSGPKTPADANH